MCWRGGALVLEDLVLIGTLSAFTSYAVGIFEPIQQIARNIADILSLQANIERVMGLLEQEPLITDTPEVIEKYGTAFEAKRENWEPIRGDIEFRDVTFRYPDGSEDVLSHFNLKIPAGSTIAIVGETGAGKSTLVNLPAASSNRRPARCLSTGATTASAASCGCTAASAMCCRARTCFPAP